MVAGLCVDSSWPASANRRRRLFSPSRFNMTASSARCSIPLATRRCGVDLHRASASWGAIPACVVNPRGVARIYMIVARGAGLCRCPGCRQAGPHEASMVLQTQHRGSGSPFAELVLGSLASTMSLPQSPMARDLLGPCDHLKPFSNRFISSGGYGNMQARSRLAKARPRLAKVRMRAMQWQDTFIPVELRVARRRAVNLTRTHFL